MSIEVGVINGIDVLSTYADAILGAIAAPPSSTTASAERCIAQAWSIIEIRSAASIRSRTITASIEDTRTVILRAPMCH
jgi:hypothetical protein